MEGRILSYSSLSRGDPVDLGGEDVPMTPQHHGQFAMIKEGDEFSFFLLNVIP